MTDIDKEKLMLRCDFAFDVVSGKLGERFLTKVKGGTSLNG